MDDAGAFAELDELAAEHLEGVLGVGEIGEERLVGSADEIGALHAADLGVVAKLLGVMRARGLGDDDVLAVLLQQRIVRLRMHREREVGRQRPGRRRPGEELRRDRLAGLGAKLEGDRQRRVLTRPRGIVDARLEIRQRGLHRPGIGNDAVALIDQPFVEELFEGPHDALHVGDVHRLVVVLEIDPARLPRDIALPVGGELHHRGAAGIVELVDAHRLDLGLAVDVELLLDGQLGRNAMRVPAEAALDHLAAHGLVARDDVLHVAGDDMAVMREAVGEGRAVIEDEFGRAAAPLDRLLEGLVRLPPGADLLLHLGEGRGRLDGRIDGRFLQV